MADSVAAVPAAPPALSSSPPPVLEVRDLRTHFDTDEGLVRSVDGVSWSLPRGKTLALVGESGCGKSVTAMSILRLIPQPPGRIVSGSSVLFEGRDLVTLSESDMREIRGHKIAMIFQEPMTSLNPVYSVGDQIAEAVELHQKRRGSAAWEVAVESLRAVGIPDPHRRAGEYPHQMSGGMRQRVMIAMALSCQPSVLIADEPTTALDVTIQAQILDLLRQLQAERSMSIVLITHDLGVVAEMADEVAVMYAGRIVERADVKTLFADPRHPYTQGLFRALPRLGQTLRRLEVIEGSVPNPVRFPKGCAFHPRCRLHRPGICDTAAPELETLDPVSGQAVRCWAVETPTRPAWSVPATGEVAGSATEASTKTAPTA